MSFLGIIQKILVSIIMTMNIEIVVSHYLEIEVLLARQNN